MSRGGVEDEGRSRSASETGEPRSGLRPSDLYSAMVLCRELDSQLSAEHGKWFPSLGEEATIVGTFSDLLPGDVAAPHYRGALAVHHMRGADLDRLVAQAWGKTSGYNKGRSIPLTGPTELGIVPWVAGDLGTTIGVATGAALAFWLEGSSRVAVCSFGDGTANRGDFHENLNLAACLKLPIVYVCQNNGWSISQPSGSYLAAPIVDRAAGYGMPGLFVDGNDVVAVREAVAAAIERARNGDGPSLIEARTWRIRGHWAADDSSYRQPSATETPGDPIELYRDRLLASGRVTQQSLDLLHQDISTVVRDAIERAKQLPEPSADDIGLNEVFATSW